MDQANNFFRTHLPVMPVQKATDIKSLSSASMTSRAPSTRQKSMQHPDSSCAKSVGVNIEKQPPCLSTSASTVQPMESVEDDKLQQNRGNMKCCMTGKCNEQRSLKRHLEESSCLLRPSKSFTKPVAQYHRSIVN